MNILIGVSASIAIYKSCDLVRELTKKGHNVKVAMTENAERWISPVVFGALSNNTVYTSAQNTDEAMPHIEIRENLDLMIVAPATANTIAKAAQGMADNIITATLLSFTGEKWIAPSMNPFMYSHPATQKNIKTLSEFGYKILDAQNGPAVCGDEGKGKMISVDDIIQLIEKI